jgi:hypothetical protein
VALVIVLIGGGRALRPVWQRIDSQPVRQVAVELWDWFETQVGGVVDKLYIRYYDRRAPVQPTPTEQPEGTPASQNMIPTPQQPTIWRKIWEAVTGSRGR